MGYTWAYILVGMFFNTILEVAYRVFAASFIRIWSIVHRKIGHLLQEESVSFILIDSSTFDSIKIITSKARGNFFSVKKLSVILEFLVYIQIHINSFASFRREKNFYSLLI